MGLFNFLKKDKQEYSKNLESIYEISKIEINDLIVDAKLLSEEKIDDNLVIQEYQKKLVRPLMNLFDSVNFKILKENSKIKYDDYQNVNIGIATFFNSEKSLDNNQMKHVVNDILKLSSIDDDYWTDVDEIRIQTGSWRGRNLLFDNTINIRLDKNLGFIVDIIGLNSFIKRIV